MTDWSDMNTCVEAPEVAVMPIEMQFDITLAEINAFSPCDGLLAESFVEFENPTYTLIDVLENGIAIPLHKFWVVTRFVGLKINRLMSVWCLTFLFENDPETYPLAVFNAMDAALGEADGILTYEEVAAYYNQCWIGSKFANEVEPINKELEKIFSYGCQCTKADAGDGTFGLVGCLRSDLDAALVKMRELIEEELTNQ